MHLIKDRKTAVIGMLLTALLWSTGGMLIKMVSGHPIAISGARSGIAGLMMFAYMKFKPHKLNKTIILGAIFYTMTVVGFVVSNKLTTAANAILLQYISPVWVAVFARIVLKDKLRRSDFVAIAIMLSGLVLFFLDELTTGMMLGNLVAIGTSFSFAAFFIAVKKMDRKEMIWPVIYGNALTLLIGLPFFTKELVAGTSLIGIILLGVFQIGLAYIIYSKSMPYLSALDAILIPIIEPLLNPVWVFFMIGELPSLLSLIGGAVVISSVVGRSYYRMKKPVSDRDRQVQDPMVY